MVLIREILKRLNEHAVRFVLIGGYAGSFHGSTIVTEDVDVCAPFDEDNVAKILTALADVHPKFRMRPEKPPVPTDLARLKGFRNLYLATDVGQLDILSEVAALGNFDQVLANSIDAEIDGIPCRVLSLNALIASKRAVGREKDLRTARELEAMRQENKGE